MGEGGVLQPAPPPLCGMDSENRLPAYLLVGYRTLSGSTFTFMANWACSRFLSQSRNWRGVGRMGGVALGRCWVELGGVWGCTSVGDGGGVSSEKDGNVE